MNEQISKIGLPKKKARILSKRAKKARNKAQRRVKSTKVPSKSIRGWIN